MINITDCYYTTIFIIIKTVLFEKHMAEETNVNLPDGNGITLPNYAMDSTAKQILDELKKQKSTDKKTIAVMEQLLEQAKKSGKNDEDSSKEADKDRDKSLALLKQLNASRTGTGPTGGVAGGGAGGGGVAGAASKASGALGKFASSLIGVAGGAMQLLLDRTALLGDTILGLTDVGAGFDDASGTTVGLIADLQRLGLSTDQAGSAIKGFSTAVQVMGKTSFAEMQKQFVAGGDFARKFGLTMAESVEIMGEDLQLRAQLGMMDNINAQQQAKNSRDLYERQVKASQMLGKSIKEIRESGQGFVQSNLDFKLSMMALEKTMPGLTESVQGTIGELVGLGLSKQSAEQIMAGVFDPVAFAANSPELRQAFQALGEEGNSVMSSLEDLNLAVKNKDKEGIELGLAGMKDKFLGLAKSMNPQEQAAFISNISKSNPALGELLAGLISARAASEKVGAELSGLAQASVTYKNALSTFMGGLSSLTTDFTGIFAKPMAALAEAFTKEGHKRNKNNQLIDKQGNALTYSEEQIKKLGLTGVKAGDAIEDVTHLTEKQSEQADKTASIMAVFREVMQTASTAMENALGGSVESLAESIRTNATPVIEGLATALGLLWDAAVGVTQPFRAIYNLFTGDFESAGKNVKDAFSSIPAAIGAAVAGLYLFNKGLKAKAVAGGMGDKIKGLFGRGGTAAQTATTTPAGAAVGGGKRGGGIGGMLRGIAIGLKAIGKVPVAAILKAGLILGGITLAVMGFAKALDIAKDAFVPFGQAIKSVMEGVGTIIEKIGGAISGTITSIAEGIASVITAAKGPSESELLDAQTASIERLSMIPTDSMVGIASSIDLISAALTNFGAAVGADGFFSNTGADIDKQNEQISVFAKFAGLNADGIKASADAIGGMVDVYTRFMNLDSSKILSVASAVNEANDAVKPSVADMAMSGASAGWELAKSAFGFGDSESAANPPTPSTAASTNTPVMATPVAQTSASSPATMESNPQLAMLAEIKAELAHIARNTKNTAKAADATAKNV